MDLNTNDTACPDEAFTDTYAFTYLVVALELLTVILIVLGNGLVVLAVLKEKQFQTITHWYLLNLAVADLIMGALTVPLDVFVTIISGARLTDSDKFAPYYIVCIMRDLCGIVSAIVGSTTAVTIAVVRLAMVVRPTIQREAWFSKVRMTSFIVIWLFAGIDGAVFISMIITAHEKGENSCLLTTSVESGLNNFLFPQPLIFGSIATVSYLAMIIKLRLRPANIRAAHASQDLRLTYIVCGVVGLYFTCWIPQCIYVLVTDEIDIDTYKYVTSVAFANSFVNPIIYWLTMVEGRQFVKRLFCGSKLHKTSSKSPSVTATVPDSSSVLQKY